MKPLSDCKKVEKILKKVSKMERTEDGEILFPGDAFWYELDRKLVKMYYIGVHKDEGSYIIYPKAYDQDDASGDGLFYAKKSNAARANKAWHEQNDDATERKLWGTKCPKGKYWCNTDRHLKDLPIK